LRADPLLSGDLTSTHGCVRGYEIPSLGVTAKAAKSWDRACGNACGVCDQESDPLWRVAKRYL